ncbi:MAG: hypothetical protein COT39_01720 [Parcubacteria group bacterium CG08_land_8_20_14_0_20_48_21]|nr:MAG: hypothetical protein AUK21_02640 [Parcubacteria group bacterium CG2_30_48_51]PIS32959.1 MAG: hypothetical protein COT39_01720 [Parcubacteria group bacterium CG08_land_8_20_14_0_20_48_21]PIW78882.1 MAG: hypothetical protein COZ99_03980 [Parcubacteria group bacterium CG_4_8_14_3_um_filter_48_16]PIY77926.1 MAG: hypothetical protein COY83_02640 [Parcubacteria group bacterium CG_4_10_14_0_8_um_filter_48_154]PIZ78610.1 MAG: hypothetical protein COY03_00045 [bacterium CG_4_10_14_0_2_um_filter_
MVERLVEIIAMTLVLALVVTIILGIVIAIEVFNFLNNFGVAEIGPSRAIAFATVAGVLFLGLHWIYRRYREFQNYS